MTNNNQVILDVTSRFMQNYERMSPVSNHQEVGTGTSSDGRVMFFSIGDDNNLYLFQQDDGSEAGWSKINLTSGLGGKVHHFAITQDTAGDPVAAISFLKSTDTNNSLVYHTKDFTANNTNRWIGWGSQPAIGLVQKFAVGVGSTDNKTYIAFAALENQNVTTYYVDANSKTWQPQEVSLPENAKKVMDLKVGHAAKYEEPISPGSPPFSEATLFVLFQNVAGDSELIGETIPGGKRNHAIPVDTDAAAIAITPDGEGNSNLFVGGKSLYFYDAAAQQLKADDPVSAGAVLIGQFKEPITTLAYDKNIPTTLDIWARTSEGNLYIAHEEGGDWSTPLIMGQQVSPEVTTWKNPVTGTTDLFYITGDDQLYYMRQDGGTTMWKQTHIKTELLDEMEEFQSYSIEVKLTDGNGVPLANKTLSISASAATEVVLNKKNYYTDPYTPVNGTTDMEGKLTILNRVDAMESPQIRIASDLFSDVVEVMPSSETKANLRAFNQKLQNDPDGVMNMQVTNEYGETSPLLTGQYKNKQNITAAHQVLSKLHGLAQKPTTQPAFVNVPPLQSGGSSLVTTGSNTTFNNKVNASSMNAGGWGVDFTGAQPKYMDGTTLTNFVQKTSTKRMANVAASESVGSKIKHFFGNLFHAIKEEFIKITHFIVQKVKEGIQIVIHTLEEVFEVIVEVIEQIWQVISWVLKKVLGLLLKALIKLLGFLFNWKYILATKDALVQLANGSIDALVKEIGSAEDFITNFFNALEDKILGQDLVKQLGSFSSESPNQNAQAHKNAPTHHSDSASGWMSHHLKHGNMFGGSGMDDPFSTDTIANQIMSTIKNLATEEIQTAIKVVEDIGEDLANKIGKASFGEIATDILKIIAAGLLDEVKNLIVAILDLIKIVFNGFKEIANTRIDIPILTWLYEKVICKGDGSKFTIMDCGALIIAFPASIIYKWVTKSEILQTDAVNAGLNSLKSFKLSLFDNPAATSDVKTSRLAAMSNRTAADADPPTIPQPMLDASFGLGGICLSVFRGINSIFAALSVPMPPLKRAGKSGLKFSWLATSFSIAGWACSFTNVVMGLTAPKDPKSTLHPKSHYFEKVMTFLQIVMPFCSLVGSIGAKNDGAASFAGITKCIMGWVNAACGIALMIWQEVEDYKKSSPQPQWIKTDDGLKCASTVLLGVGQGLVYPAKKAKASGPGQIILMICIAVGGIGSSIVNGIRSGTVHKHGQMFSPM